VLYGLLLFSLLALIHAAALTPHTLNFTGNKCVKICNETEHRNLKAKSRLLKQNIYLLTYLFIYQHIIYTVTNSREQNCDYYYIKATEQTVLFLNIMFIR